MSRAPGVQDPAGFNPAAARMVSEVENAKRASSERRPTAAFAAAAR
jgi:hypothetical protein